MFDAALNGLGLSPSSWSNKSVRINKKYNILHIDTVGAHGLWTHTMSEMERNDHVPWCLKRFNQVLSGYFKLKKNYFNSIDHSLYIPVL